MAIYIGIDPPTEPARMKIWVFILLAWKDTIVRAVDIKGRSSRNVFLVSIVPLIAIWFGGLWIGIIAPRHLKIFDNIVYLAFLFAPMFFMFTLTIRRRHDIGKTATSMGNPLHYLNPFNDLILVIDFLKSGDSQNNKYGPPHILRPNANHNTPKDDDKRIG